MTVGMPSAEGQRPMPRRRILAGLALCGMAAAACARDPGAEAGPLRPIGYAYLTPLPLNVAALEIAPGDPPPVPGDIGRRLSPDPAEAVRIMGRDRLSAVGTTGRAVFAPTRAALIPTGSGLTCTVGCRLEILAEVTGARLGFVTADARATATGAEASRPQAAERLLRQAMDALNVEFEFQLRRALRDWLVAVPPGTPGGGAGGVPAPPAGGVAREDLPRS